MRQTTLHFESVPIAFLPDCRQHESFICGHLKSNHSSREVDSQHGKHYANCSCELVTANSSRSQSYWCNKSRKALPHHLSKSYGKNLVYQ